MPEATVAAIVSRSERNQKQILLTLRRYDPFKGLWCLPGGHIDENERAGHAVMREVREETGLLFSGNFLMYFDEVFPHLHVHNVVLIFAGHATGTLLKETDEVAESRWVPIDKVAQMKLAFTHNEVLASHARRGEGGDDEA